MQVTIYNPAILKDFPTDRDLIVKLQKGNVEAFDLAYEKYAGFIHGFAFKYLKSTGETEELVQNVFLKVWENHKNLRKEPSFKAYLFTIAYNEICNVFRRRTQFQKYLGIQRSINQQTSVETEQEIDYNSIAEQISLLIARLPERQRTIFMVSREEGKPHKEIANDLGLSTGTVDNYISESLKFIRSNLRNKSFAALILLTEFLSSSY